MKEFANDKTSSAPSKARTDADPAKAKAGGGQKGPQSQAPNLLGGARAGDPWAIRMLQSAGNRAIDAALAPDGEKKSLGRLAEVNPNVAAKLARSTGKDVGDTEVKVEPELEASGKRGVAREGREIGVGSESAARDARLMVHEAAHLVQQRGGAEKGEEKPVGETVGTAQSAAPGSEAAPKESASGGVEGAQTSAGEGAGGGAGVADAEQEVVAAEDKLLAGEPVGLGASGVGELFGGNDPPQLKDVNQLLHSVETLQGEVSSENADRLAQLQELQGKLANLGKEIEKVREDEDATELLSTLDEEIGKIRDEVDGIQKSLKKEQEIQPTGIEEVDKFIEQYKVMGAVYKPASEYKKHVVGATNEERKGAARAKQAQVGAGQYFAEIDGVQVTDAMITGWETEVIELAMKGDKDVTVEIKGGTFYFYYTFEHFVGYASPGANRTKRVRVEWSSGAVHSHPRK